MTSMTFESAGFIHFINNGNFIYNRFGEVCVEVFSIAHRKKHRFRLKDEH